MSPILANAAIYFHDEGYRTDQPKLMGRHAAGEGFLKGMLDHAEIDEVVAYAESGQQFQLFERLCRSSGGRNAGLPKAWAGPEREAALARAGTLMLPGPDARRAGLAPAPRHAAALVDLRRHPHHRQPPGDGQLRRAADRAGRAVGRADLHLARGAAHGRAGARQLRPTGWRERLGATRSPRRCCR